MALRKFRSFIRDRQRLVSGRLEQNIFKEDADDTPITDAATVFIGSELSVSERRSGIAPVDVELGKEALPALSR